MKVFFGRKCFRMSFYCNLDESVPNRARGVKAMVDMRGKLASSERERDEALSTASDVTNRSGFWHSICLT